MLSNQYNKKIQKEINNLNQKLINHLNSTGKESFGSGNPESRKLNMVHKSGLGIKRMGRRGGIASGGALSGGIASGGRRITRRKGGILTGGGDEEDQIEAEVGGRRISRRKGGAWYDDIISGLDAASNFKKGVSDYSKKIKGKGGAWYDDIDNAFSTTGKIARGVIKLGLGKPKNRKVRLYGGMEGDLSSSKGVLYSQAPPAVLRDQSVRPPMPSKLTEVVAPPPPRRGLTNWQAFKLPWKWLGSLFGLGHPSNLSHPNHKQYKKLGHPSNPSHPDHKKFVQLMKKNKGSKSGNKKASPWIAHVKKYASDHGLNYREALMSPGCKSSYKK